MVWNEDSLHRWLGRVLRPRGLATDFGNDAAVLAGALERAVLCADQAIEGVHFLPDAPPVSVGRKACARALSDLAASAARPRAVLLTLRAPISTDESRLRALIRAVQSEARRLGAELIGGDLACAPGPLSMSVTAVGELAHGVKPVSRAGARAGQVLVATGPFGGSVLGRHLRIEPRFGEGAWLARLGATAMMDVSDGLALDLSRMARASGVAFEVERAPIHRDARRLARSSGRTALEHALGDGEDHELIATLPKDAVERALREAPRHCPGFAVIGRVKRGEGVFVPRDEKGGASVRFDGRGGWLHGARA